MPIDVRRMLPWLLASILLGWGCPTSPYGGGDGTGEDDDEDDAATDDDTGDDDTGDDDTGDDDTGDDDTGDDDTTNPEVAPPLHGSSGGSGGGTCPSGCVEQVGAVEYRIIVPSGYQPATPATLLLVYSGTEGGAVMTQNMLGAAPYCGLGSSIVAVIDGWDFGTGGAGAQVLDDVRDRWNIDNDRTWLLSESAGTVGGLELGFGLRPAYFATFWANDVNAVGTPSQTAAELGFAPWGNAGPGGAYAQAQTIVDGMDAAGYRFDGASPYDGPGAGQHGSPDQFLAAVSFFVGKSRL